ncbi:MAG: monovalent cation:proton antiporter-2 (CPA2) family protein [Pseudomonadota bacterium]
MGDVLLLMFIFLAAGVIAVPIATRLGLGSVLGYLLAGIAIAPLLDAFDVDVVSVQHFAEFGVVMMLFLIGLELEPHRLWQMRARLIGLGGLQVTLTAALVTWIAMLFGQPWTVALAIGLVFSLSSTAIVLQTLNEKGLLRSDGGQGSFSVLLFQDIAVIPMLAFLPLLAMPEIAELATHGAGHDETHGEDMSLVDGLAGWQRALVTLGAILALILGGSLATRPLFRFIAMARLREIFVGAALLWVIAIALLMTLVGLSPALGTFIAGVVLANSEYRHELESDIEPFKGLLLGLFFITVGASIDFGLLAADLSPILGMTAGLILLKAVVLLVLSFMFRITGSDRWLFSLGLAQAGEFGFVLLSFTVSHSVIPIDLADRLLMVVALSMLLTPGLFILYDRVIAPRLNRGEDAEADEVIPRGSVIIAGHGRFGGIVNRMLRGLGYETTVLDYSSAHLEMLRTFGIPVFFGDATRPDLLHAAGIERASMLIIAIDDREQISRLTRYAVTNFPNLHVVARAVDRRHVYELYAIGCRDIVRETFDSGVRAGRSALEALGVHPFEAERRARQFVDLDRKALAELASVYDADVPIHQNTAYVEMAREMMERDQALLAGEDPAYSSGVHRSWLPPTAEDVDAETAKGKSASVKE